MLRLFLSYSRRDAEFAHRLARALSARGADVWIDVEDIPASVKWSSAIQEGLDRCDALLIVVSPDSMQSRNVEDEWHYIMDQRKPIVPVLYRPAKVHFQLSRIQYIDFHTTPFDIALERLVAELKRLGLRFDTATTPEADVPTPSDPADAPVVPATRYRVPARMRWLLGLAGVLALVAFLLLLLRLFEEPVVPDQSDDATQFAGAASLTAVASETEIVVTRPTSSPTRRPTRTRPPVLSGEQQTATERAELDLAETAVALTDLAPFVPLTLTAELFTPTNTPDRIQTIFAQRQTRTQIAVEQAATASAEAQLTRAPMTATPTTPATPTPTPVPTLTPYLVDCPAAPPTQLNIGMLAAVVQAREGELRRNQNVRLAPGGAIAAAIPEGTLLYITGEPVCIEPLLWWPIQTANGAVSGWTAEGEAPDTYYIEPAN